MSGAVRIDSLCLWRCPLIFSGNSSSILVIIPAVGWFLWFWLLGIQVPWVFCVVPISIFGALAFHWFCEPAYPSNRVHSFCFSWPVKFYYNKQEFWQPFWPEWQGLPSCVLTHLFSLPSASLPWVVALLYLVVRLPTLKAELKHFELFLNYQREFYACYSSI